MSKAQFNGQREGEELEFVFRRHILVTFKNFVFLIVMAGVGFIPLVVWPENSNITFWIFLVCVIVGVMKILYGYMLWHFSVYIVTNQRIRQVKQSGLFKRTVVDLGLNKIQTVSYNIPGIFGGMFGYGTLLIQTQVGDMMIKTVSRPEEIYNKLQNVIGE